jgi:hypothetical protein
MSVGAVRSRPSSANRDRVLIPLRDTDQGASERDQAAREKSARVVAVRVWLRLGHDEVAHREVAAMLGLAVTS